MPFKRNRDVTKCNFRTAVNNIQKYFLGTANFCIPMYKTLANRSSELTVCRYTALGKTKIYYFPEDLGVFGPNNNVRLLWKKIDCNACSGFSFMKLQSVGIINNIYVAV